MVSLRAFKLAILDSDISAPLRFSAAPRGAFPLGTADGRSECRRVRSEGRPAAFASIPHGDSRTSVCNLRVESMRLGRYVQRLP